MRFKCCSKIVKFNVKGSVSFLDLFGLMILLSFYLLVIWFVTYVIVSIFTWLLESFIQSGHIGLTIEFGIHLFAFGIFFIKSVAKFLKACSFLLNYKLQINGQCVVCSSKKNYLNIPTNADPFWKHRVDYRSKGNAIIMLCPRTKSPLMKVNVGKVPVFISEACGGVFFDNSTIQ
jgi:hypothetical protein